MEKAKLALNYMVLGAPVWVWLFTLVVLPAINDIVDRTKSVRAHSIFQAFMNVLKASPLGKMPFIGAALEALDTPQPQVIKAVAESDTDPQKKLPPAA